MTDADVGFLLRVRGNAAVFGRTVARPIRRRLPFGLLRRVHRRLHRLDPNRWTDADPFAVVDVNPDRITRSIVETAPRYPQWGRRQGGRWDRSTDPFADRPVAVAIRRRLEDGRPWSETPLREAFRDQLRRFGNAWGHTSMAEFERRCAAVDRLCESIRENGYRRQSELPDGVPVLGEVNVDVGRDGELLWRAYGQHRLAIAKALDLESIPVFVHRRHREWGRIRRRARTDPDALPSRLVDHPDLRTLLE